MLRSSKIRNLYSSPHDIPTAIYSINNDVTHNEIYKHYIFFTLSHQLLTSK